MKTEPLAGLTFRRNAAILLSLAAAYLLVTDWVIEPWSACIAFAIGFAVAAAISIRAFRSDFELRFHWVLLPLTAAVVWGFIQLAAGIPQYRFATWWSTLSWAAALAFFWSALQVFRASRLSRAFELGVVIFGALTAFEAVLQLFSGDARFYGMAVVNDDAMHVGAFRNHDHFSALMELILPLALWSAMRAHRRTWLYFTAAGIIYASVIASQSRAGAAIATLEILILLAVNLLRKRARGDAPKARRSVAAAIVVAIAGGVVGWSAVLDRFKVRDLFEYRREFLQSTLRMIHDRPWFGFGLGSWPLVYPRYAFIDPGLVANHAHNDWVEWASDGGIVFALLIGLVALRALWISIELPWGIGTIAVFAHAAVDFPFQRPPLLIAVLMTLALMEIEHERARRI
jgi:O-antigen ligase